MENASYEFCSGLCFGSCAQLCREQPNQQLGERPGIHPSTAVKPAPRTLPSGSAALRPDNTTPFLWTAHQDQCVLRYAISEGSL